MSSAPGRHHTAKRGRRRRRAGEADLSAHSEPAVTISVTPAVPLRPATPAGPTVRPASSPPPRTPGPAEAEVLASSDDGTSPKEKAQRPPASWENFGPPPQQPPSALRRMLAWTEPVRQFLRHEWTLAALAGLLLSLALNLALPVVLGDGFPDPRTTLPQDVWDPSLVSYLIAWGGHALAHDPAHLWHLNGFYPSPYGLAYTDSLLGYAPTAIIGTGPEVAILRYNILFILAQALVFTGAYALARQLGAERVGSAVAGVAFAVAPWRLAQAGHLQVLSTGGIALALAMLARGHGVRWRRDEIIDQTTDQSIDERDDRTTVAALDAHNQHAHNQEAHNQARPDETDGPDPGGRRKHGTGPLRPGWALAGWLVAAWQLSIGFGIGLVFIYVLLGVFLIGGLWWALRRPWPPWRLLLADGVGGLVFAAVALLMAQPYLKVLELYPYARRNADWVALYSPPVRGWLTAPAESLLWGSIHAGTRAQLSVPGEMALLPGFALCALAIAGLVFSIWPVRVRLALGAGVAATVVLGLGTHGPAQGRAGYLALFALPGFEGLRTPGRLAVWTTLLLALLAAGAVGGLIRRSVEVVERWRGVPQPSALAKAALLLPVVLVLAEGLGTTPHRAVPPAPAVLSTVPAPYLVLPTDQVPDMQVLLWSTDRFAPTVNGGSGLVPTEQQRVRERVASFPDAESVAYLRELGVRTVVVLPARAAGTLWESAAELPIEGLGISRDVTDEAVVFHLAG